MNNFIFEKIFKEIKNENYNYIIYRKVIIKMFVFFKEKRERVKDFFFFCIYIKLLRMLYNFIKSYFLILLFLLKLLFE